MLGIPLCKDGVALRQRTAEHNGPERCAPERIELDDHDAVILLAAVQEPLEAFSPGHGSLRIGLLPSAASANSASRRRCSSSISPSLMARPTSWAMAPACEGAKVPSSTRFVTRST